MKQTTTLFDEKNYNQLTTSTIQNPVEEAYRQGIREGIQRKEQQLEQEASAHHAGEVEHIKEKRKAAVQLKDTMAKIVEKDHVVLLETKTVFPFDFFPDTLTIEPMKINIISKSFIASHTVTTISSKDLVDVWLETAFFLSNLVIRYLPKVDTPTGMIKPTEIRINLLNNWDAKKAKNILKGIQIAQREGIDIMTLNPKEVTTFIEKLGSIEA